jgi:meso-butanediol dehydrogenase / (S,S)-butanediol dehydrogenase / diacetyl reductase
MEVDQMAGRLADRVALITGTGGGQGRAAAILFAQEGAKVVGGDLKSEGAQETLETVQAMGGSMISKHPIDFGDPAQAHAWIDFAVSEHGRIDIVYNNASAPKYGPIADIPEENWDFAIRNELSLVFYVIKAAWPHLVANGGGSIVNTASITGINAMQPAAGIGMFPHAATKHGVIGMTRELALEGGPIGIRVNAISPGLILTPATAPYADAEWLQAFVDHQAIKRTGQPEDIARAALFLASDEAAFVTGENLVVDGGYTIL